VTARARVRSGFAAAAAVATAAVPAALVTLAGASAGDGELRAHAANHPFRASLISVCVRARHPERVRALSFGGAQLPASVATGHEPGSHPRCRRDELRLLRFEALPIAGRRTYVRRGGCALPCVRRQATVHVPARALARPVHLLSRSARNANGEPVAGCDAAALTAPQRVGAELRHMYYKTPAELERRRKRRALGRHRRELVELRRSRRDVSLRPRTRRALRLPAVEPAADGRGPAARRRDRPRGPASGPAARAVRRRSSHAGGLRRARRRQRQRAVRLREGPRRPRAGRRRGARDLRVGPARLSLRRAGVRRDGRYTSTTTGSTIGRRLMRS
jgi:hypothetical protein